MPESHPRKRKIKPECLITLPWETQGVRIKSCRVTAWDEDNVQRQLKHQYSKKQLDNCFISHLTHYDNVRVIAPQIPGAAAPQFSSWPGLVCVCSCVPLAAARVPPCRRGAQTRRLIPQAGHKGCFWTTETEVHWFNICVLLVKARTHLTKADEKGMLCKENLGLEACFGFFSALLLHLFCTLFLRFLNNEDNCGYRSEEGLFSAFSWEKINKTRGLGTCCFVHALPFLFFWEGISLPIEFITGNFGKSWT